MTSMRVWLLDSFSDDELSEISAYLIGDTEDVEIEWNNADEGSDVISVYVSTSDNTMIMIDRDCYDSNSYIVADGNSMQSEWYLRAVLDQYNIEYTDDWKDNEAATQILRSNAVPYARIAASDQSAVALYNGFENEDVTLETYVYTDGVEYSYSEDSAGVEESLNALNIGGRADEEEE